MVKTIEIDIRKIKILCIVYVYIGIIIFFAGWVRPLFSIPLFFTVIVNIFKYAKKLFNPNMNKSSAYNIPVKVPIIFIMVAFCLVLGLLCGFAGFFRQASDWEKHNLVLSDLVNRKWPVCYTEKDSAMLTYYIGQYLFPAVCGKLIAGYRFAEIAMLFYNSLGIFLALLLLYKMLDAKTTNKQLLIMFVSFLFGTCLFLSRALYGATSIGINDISQDNHWISKTILLQYKTIFNSLRWTFPQAITPWIVTSIFIDNIDEFGLYAFWGLPLILYSPFALVGIAFLMTSVLLKEILLTKSLIPISQCFSFENISSIVVFIVPLIYLSGNIFSDKPTEFKFHYINYNGMGILYFCFILSFLIYSIIIYESMKSNVLYFSVNILLLLLPFFQLGRWNDFILNVSIPAVWVLMVLTLKALFYYAENKERHFKKLLALSFFLILGMIYPLEEAAIPIMAPISISGTAPIYSNQSLEKWAVRDGSIGVVPAYSYFTYDYERSLFYSMFARK